MRVFLFLSVLLLTTFSFSQCNQFYLIQVGETIVLNNYNAKDKLIGSQEITLKSENGDEAIYVMQSFDKKGKPEMDPVEIKILCAGDNYKIDMNSILAPMIEGYKDMEVTVDMDYRAFPKVLEVGMELPDAETKVSVDMGVMNMNMQFLSTNRKVIGKEKITSEMGSFECFILEETSKMDMKLAKMESLSKTYISSEIGFIKVENYKSNGKLTGYTLRVK